ncbi:hypothetical protein EBZ37_05900 [bacterium]|nr:hypothetical protein [bacterium]
MRQEFELIIRTSVSRKTPPAALWTAFLGILIALPAISDDIVVSPLPYSTRTKPFSAYCGGVRGDPRTVGMAGATVGLADTYTASIDNPAGLAMTLALGDTHASTNRIYDGHLQNPDAAISASGLGAAVTIGKLGISLGMNNVWDEGQYYQIPGVTSPQWVEAYVREFRFGAAYRLAPSLSLGTHLRFAHLVQGVGPENGIAANPTASDSALGVGVGLLYRLPKRRLLFGASWSSGITLDAAGSVPYSFTTLPGFAQPVLIPSKIAIGVGYVPNRLLRADFSLMRVSATPGAALLSDQTKGVGSVPTVEPHLGVAYTFADFAPIRGLVFAGSYLQPSRIEDRSSRLHVTLGAEAKWSFMNFGIGVDTASSYSNYLASIGVDPFKVMELLDIIPRAQPQPPRGFLPDPWYQSDEGLTAGLQNQHQRDRGPGIDPLDVGKKIPGKIEERVRSLTPGQVLNTLQELPKSIRKDIEDVRDTLKKQEQENQN